ncbi:hypothetical protein SAMN02745196_00445 [Clostridium collagenovorans DSM 3089]|uniref:Uncharacterized protein n=1 Tax=Clostridium collagenovorans DSM 3089 TaxID=1121306 RepID=A0A1M5T6Q8_9CLOT|nr:hypothetical protein [Clostridium collagenovorans]SHH46053.1 hypothetical protein SAMN02745196_00445 [Clostridium collagenovorans DSM 3089]
MSNLKREEIKKIIINCFFSFFILYFFGILLPKIISVFLWEFYDPGMSGGVEVFMSDGNKAKNNLLYNYLKIISIYFRGI